MGAQEDGSPWTGEKGADCESECGWYGDGSCVVVGELISEFADELDGDLEDHEWPACSVEDQCKWQSQLGDDIPCPPRLALMANEDPERCLF